MATQTTQLIFPLAASTEPLEQYVHPPETKQDIKYADLVTIDLSEFDQPGGKEKLAAQLKDVVHEVGFFYVTNFGLTQEQVDRQFAIAKEFFSLPEEERRSFRAPLEEGIYNGYRPLGSIEILPGLRDNIEFYNIMKFLPQYERTHPDVIRRHWAEIEKFHRHVHEHIAYRLFRLLAIVLEIPEDELEKGHLYDSNCDSGLRYMCYRARSAEENEKYKSLYSRGHTDNGTITFVFQQPVAGLQVKKHDDSEWEYLRIPSGTIAVNIADLLSILSNGYLKSGVHRVITPPKDQQHLDRLGVLYFVRPSDRLTLRTVDSPLLRRLGYYKEGITEINIPAPEWTRARIKKNWTSSPTDPNEGTSMAGFSVKHFHD
ncbi:2OG-Fe(II) oxygenase family oxidoreductase, putative [Aspergillus fumigatus Z5]|nr:2OG-Fe(II) oxygenase family oxidoreductase, putative [Aspergillus fumigatus Z5]